MKIKIILSTLLLIGIIILLPSPKKDDIQIKSKQPASQPINNLSIDSTQPKPIKESTKQAPEQKAINEVEAVVKAYASLNDQSTQDDHKSVYRTMMQTKHPAVFTAILSDMQSTGFPKLPEYTKKQIGTLHMAYMAFANSIETDDQLREVEKLIFSDLPDLYSPDEEIVGSENYEQNTNKIILTSKLGISGNPNVFSILKKLYLENPRIDIGIGMSAFWYDYSTKHFRQYYIAALDPMEPFYNKAYPSKTRIPTPDFMRVYQDWAHRRVSNEVSQFMKDINYNSRTIKYQ